MTEPRFSRIVHSATVRLTGTYLTIIMLMSIVFSFVLYNTSSRQLDRQEIPQEIARVYTSLDQSGERLGSASDLQQFLEQRADEGRHELLVRLAIMNVTVFLAGVAVSYTLARRSLGPIEEAMEAQTRFVSDASHELRTPLTTLQTTNEVALRKSKLTIAEARKLIGHNVEEAVRLKQLSDGLLGLLKHDGHIRQRTAVSLQAVTTEAVNHIAPAAIAKRMAVNDSVANIKVRSDEASLIQIVTILLDNAVKYSPNGTEIFVDAKARSKTAQLTIRDQGIGIKATDLPHIFDRFYRADTSRSHRQVEGYGLGLAIAKKLADQLDIDITVKSSQDEGTTFTLKLPLA